MKDESQVLKVVITGCLTEERVQHIFNDCLYGGVYGSGGFKNDVYRWDTGDVNFIPERIEEHKKEIQSLLLDLPNVGFGISRLDLCFDNLGNKWTSECNVVEQLVCLGLAIDAVEQWIDGIPYIRVKFEEFSKKEKAMTETVKKATQKKTQKKEQKTVETKVVEPRIAASVKKGKPVKKAAAPVKPVKKAAAPVKKPAQGNAVKKSTPAKKAAVSVKKPAPAKKPAVASKKSVPVKKATKKVTPVKKAAVKTQTKSRK